MPTDANVLSQSPLPRVRFLNLRFPSTKQPPPGGVPSRAAPAASGPAGAAAQLQQDLKRQVAILQEHLVIAEARATAAESNAAAAVNDCATPDEVIGDKIEVGGPARAEKSTLKETIASADSSLREALADNQRLSTAVADAQGELAYEADRRAAFEREVAALRSRLQHQEQRQPAVAGVQVEPPVDQQRAATAEALLAHLQATCSRQAEDVAEAIRRAGTAEQELAEARTRIADLTDSVSNLQGLLGAAEGKVQEYARGSADAQARVEAAERAMETEATRVHTGLQLRLQDAESRAASLGEELEAALAAQHERNSQQASEAAAVDTLKVWCLPRSLRGVVG